MSEEEYGSERRDDFYSVIGDFLDAEISPSILDGDELLYENAVISGWVPPPSNVGRILDEDDRNISDVPFELANLYGSNSGDGEEGTVYVSRCLGDPIEPENGWKGAEIIQSDEDVGADIYMIFNTSGLEEISDPLDSFHGADAFVAEFLLDRYDTLDEDFTDYAFESVVEAAKDQYDTVFVADEQSDERVYVVARDESEEPDPGEATAEMRFPGGSASGERAKPDSEKTEAEVEDKREHEKRPKISG